MLFVPQGTNASALEKDIGPEQFPINEHYFGLVNVSVTEHGISSICQDVNHNRDMVEPPIYLSIFK